LKGGAVAAVAATRKIRASRKNGIWIWDLSVKSPAKGGSGISGFKPACRQAGPWRTGKNSFPPTPFLFACLIRHGLEHFGFWVLGFENLEKT
jgi:hypothetical protein